jgi:putative intracellular protease/amidase
MTKRKTVKKTKLQAFVAKVKAVDKKVIAIAVAVLVVLALVF